ncbi:dihydrolipoamide acetyltransferase family protein [Candidatus Palauibacter sp.]|uniref:dihydrolipoamide acetyltransferase family protein n=1 Tax=Candidatus Palauibacter sp. TaxID=3101350 RepID=UPI003B52C9D6
MAQLSPTMEEGKLIEWKVAEGDTVSQGDIVAEIETDKANMDVEALGGGVLRKIVVQAGATVPVGALIGVIAAPDESIDALLAEAAAARTAEAALPEPAVAPPEDATAVEEPVGATEARTADEPAGAGAGAGTRAAGGRIKASPVARRMAAEGGIALASLTGSGPGGRIVKADVEAALASRTAAAPPRGPTPVLPPLTPAPPPLPHLEDRVEEPSQMRKAIARRLVQSIGPVPHFFLTTEVDMGRALELRADLNARFAEGRIGVNDLLLKATAEALNRHPAVNASWEENAIRYHGAVHLGIAAAVDGGLITPVLRDAGRKGLRRISTEARDLITRGRERKLAPEEYQGGTFSVSNLGMFEIDQFTAIINPPEAGILAIGQTVEKPVVVAGEVVGRKRMRVTMSCDHRVIDGAMGAAFLGAFKAMLENPLEMLL